MDSQPYDIESPAYDPTTGCTLDADPVDCDATCVSHSPYDIESSADYDPCGPADCDSTSVRDAPYDIESPVYCESIVSDVTEPEYDPTSPTFRPCNTRLTPEPPREHAWFQMQMLSEVDLLTRTLTRWNAYAPFAPRTVCFDRCANEGGTYLFMDTGSKGTVFCCVPYENSAGYWRSAPKDVRWQVCSWYFDLTPSLL